MRPAAVEFRPKEHTEDRCMMLSSASTDDPSAMDLLAAVEKLPVENFRSARSSGTTSSMPSSGKAAWRAYIARDTLC
jgi:hypothetical protein